MFDEEQKKKIFLWSKYIFAVAGVFFLFKTAMAFFDLVEQHPKKTAALVSFVLASIGWSYWRMKNVQPIMPEKFPWFSKKVDYTKANDAVDENLQSSFREKPIAEYCEEKKIPVLGGKGAGKQSLLNQLLKEEAIVSLVDESKFEFIREHSLSSILEKNKFVLEKYKKALFSILVITQDLTDYEMQFIDTYASHGHDVILVWNKIDILSKSEHQEIKEELERKLSTYSDKVHLVECMADPSDQIRIREKTNGKQTEEVVKVNPDIHQVAEIITSKIKSCIEQKDVA